MIRSRRSRVIVPCGVGREFQRGAEHPCNHDDWNPETPLGEPRLASIGGLVVDFACMRTYFPTPALPRARGRERGECVANLRNGALGATERHRRSPPGRPTAWAQTVASSLKGANVLTASSSRRTAASWPRPGLLPLFSGRRIPASLGASRNTRRSGARNPCWPAADGSSGRSRCRHPKGPCRPPGRRYRPSLRS